jgi:monoamine oxidase
MTRHTLILSLRRAYKIAQASIETGIPTDELVEIFQQKISRRCLFYTGLGLASAVAGVTLHDGSSRMALGAVPKVLVVGAGIAGLTAAYRLKQAGIPVDIIEARNRVGGRMYTARNIAGTSIYADLGGEFIDTIHTSLRRLVNELGLQTADLYAADKGLVPSVMYFQGRKIKDSELAEWSVALVKKIKQDLEKISIKDVSYRTRNPNAIALDSISIADYLEQAQIHPILNKLLQNSYTQLYGREASEQSCLNMLLFISTDNNNLRSNADSDERYQVLGGNDRVISLLAKSLSNFIETGTELEAINPQGEKGYRVSFRSGNRSFEKNYERVLLTLPYSTLRLVAINLDFPLVKQKAINELGYGTNSKLVTAYRERIWKTRYKSTAFISTELDFQGAWESNRNHRGSSGVITNFTGGKQGLAIGKGSTESQAQILLPQLEKIFPGISEQSAGEAIRAYWTGEQYTQGSYSCYLPGQWTGISGAEQENVGNLFFAGEHCSQKFQGYMEGGCRTGEIAAAKIMRSLGVSWKGQG